MKSITSFIKSKKYADNKVAELTGLNLQSVNDTLSEHTTQLAQKANKDEVNSLATGKANITDMQVVQTQIGTLVANAGNTDGNAELLDIRIDGNGNAFDTAGDAVRYELISLKALLDSGYKSEVSGWEKGGINASGVNTSAVYSIRTKDFIIPTSDLNITINAPDSTYQFYVWKYNLDGTFNSYTLYYKSFKLTYSATLKYKFSMQPNGSTAPVTLYSLLSKLFIPLNQLSFYTTMNNTINNFVANSDKSYVRIESLDNGYFKKYTDWKIGGLDATGNPKTASYSIVSNDFFIPTTAFKMVITTGYAVYLYKYLVSDSSYVAWTQYTNTTVIPYNSLYKYKIIFQKNPESGSTVITDISTYTPYIAIFYAVLNGVGSNPVAGKTTNFVGDSITHQNLYHVDVANNLGLVATKYAVPGSTLAINPTSEADIIAKLGTAFGTQTSFVERVTSGSMGQADIWVVFGGTNDWYYNSSLGTIADTIGSTVYGALKLICEHILSRSNNPKLILVTPSQANRARFNAGAATITYEQIRQAIIDIGILYSVPVIDLYALSGINQINAVAATNPTTSDGVHWTNYGRFKAIPLFEKSLKEFDFRDRQYLS